MLPPTQTAPISPTTIPIVVPARINFAQFRGDSFIQQLKFRRAHPGSNRPFPVDLTGAAITATVKRTVVEPDNVALAQKTVGAGITIDDPVNGLFTVTLDPFDTIHQADGIVRLELDVQVKEATGRVTTVLRGTLALEPDVTRTY